MGFVVVAAKVNRIHAARYDQSAGPQAAETLLEAMSRHPCGRAEDRLTEVPASVLARLSELRGCFSKQTRAAMPLVWFLGCVASPKPARRLSSAPRRSRPLCGRIGCLAPPHASFALRDGAQARNQRPARRYLQRSKERGPRSPP